MPSINLRTGSVSCAGRYSLPSPLPAILQTPLGLAIVEVQGTIHGPFPSSGDAPSQSTEETLIGRLDFPSYDSEEPGEGKWMKKVYLYVGKHQRLTGEIKKLAKPLAVIRKADTDCERHDHRMSNPSSDDLEVLDIVKFKLLFSGRPEPVGE